MFPKALVPRDHNTIQCLALQVDTIGLELVDSKAMPAAGNRFLQGDSRSTYAWTTNISFPSSHSKSAALCPADPLRRH